MHALWFIAFAWLFFGGTTMPAKRANRKAKSLPRQHLEYLDELFHKVQTSGSQVCEVIEPPTNYKSPQFALRCLPRFYYLDPLTRFPTAVKCPRCEVVGTLLTFGQPHRLRTIFDLPRPIWMRQARYRCTRCKGTPRAAKCLLLGVAREHFRVYLTQESGITERCLLHVLHLLEEGVAYNKVSKDFGLLYDDALQVTFRIYQAECALKSRLGVTLDKVDLSEYSALTKPPSVTLLRTFFLRYFEKLKLLYAD